MSTNAIRDRSSLQALDSASKAFWRETSVKGYWEFELVGAEDRWKVYEQFWIDRGRPLGNPEFGREAFHNKNGLSSTNRERMNAIDGYIRLEIGRINAASIDALRSASTAFTWENSEPGYRDFQLASPEDQCKVYEQLWINRGRPLGNPEYGREAFHNRNGLSSTFLERINAIDGYVRSGIERINLMSESREVRTIIASPAPQQCIHQYVPDRSGLSLSDMALETVTIVAIGALLCIALGVRIGQNDRGEERRNRS